MPIRAVFGGSFDPPHIGHVLAVHYVLSVGLADRVTVVPVFEHAFDKASAPFAERVRLAGAAFSAIPAVDVSSVESSLPRPSYTLHTLQALARSHPQDQLRLLIGADVLADTPHWYRFEEVKQLAPLIVLGRVGSPSVGGAPLVLPCVSSSAVRMWLGQGADAETDLLLRAVVPHEVLGQIRQLGLYA